MEDPFGSTMPRLLLALLVSSLLCAGDSGDAPKVAVIRLVDAINALHEAVAQSREAELVEATLGTLERYSEVHFATEELMLEEASYPRLEQHRRQHRQFIEQLQSFRGQLGDGGAGLGHGMAQFLGSWLVNHIMVSDKAYVAFLRSSCKLPAYRPKGS